MALKRQFDIVLYLFLTQLRTNDHIDVSLTRDELSITGGEGDNGTKEAD